MSHRERRTQFLEQQSQPSSPDTPENEPPTRWWPSSQQEAADALIQMNFRDHLQAHFGDDFFRR